MSAGHLEDGMHLVRAFPRWFTQRDDGGARLYTQYNSGIGEWGYYLDEHAILHGQYPGQLDRCWWPSLGKLNFLSKIHSSFKSFVLEGSSTDGGGDLPFLLDRLSECGSELDLFKLNVSSVQAFLNAIINKHCSHNYIDKLSTQSHC